MDWRTHLRTHGYAHFLRLVPDLLVADALGAIERDVRENYDAGRQLEYDHRSYCPDLLGTPPVMNLLEASPARGVLDEALGIDDLEIWLRGLEGRRRHYLANMWDGRRI